MTEDKDKYSKFIILLEIVYAILVAWGFARIAEFFKSENIFDWAVLVIATLVLIRFFFAPAHNVGALIYSLPMNVKNAQKIIFFDIPVLIAHSFIYYRTCYNASIHAYDLFYLNLAVLLVLNSVWLFSIRRRLEKASNLVPKKFSLWIGNNLVFSALLFAAWLILKSPHFPANLHLSANFYFWISFALIFLNSVVDLKSCALEYLEET